MWIILKKFAFVAVDPGLKFILSAGVGIKKSLFLVMSVDLTGF